MGGSSGVTRLVVVGLVCAVLIGGCWFAARGIMQHRAEYPGGLIFVGHAEGLFGVRYERFYIWRSPDYTDPLPALTVCIGDSFHPIEELTPEHMSALGGSRNDGGLRDAQGNTLRYRFENGRLTYFSVDATNRPVSGTADNVHLGTFQALLAEGEPFAMPVTHRELVHHAGKPLDTYWILAN